jgi:hypothetical protein
LERRKAGRRTKARVERGSCSTPCHGEDAMQDCAAWQAVYAK